MSYNISGMYKKAMAGVLGAAMLVAPIKSIGPNLDALLSSSSPQTQQQVINRSIGDRSIDSYITMNDAVAGWDAKAAGLSAAQGLKDSQQAYQNKNWDSVIKIMQPTYDKLSQGMGGEGNPADVKEWVAFKDRLSDAYVRRGEATFGKGNLDSALADFQVSVKVNPNNWIGYNDIASIYYVRGNKEKSASFFEKAIALSPKDTNPYVQLSQTYTELGRYADAAKVARQAIDIDPNSAIAHNDLGVALEGDGKMAPAIKEYDKAISLNPDFKIAKDNLLRAKSRTNSSN